MDKKTKRLYFIDAMRAWAILMMLQGHFIDGLLDPMFRDTSNVAFNIWKYFRGITAPVFFTVSGFIFTFLLIKGDKTGLQNPRVKKGVKRGLELLFIGYLLRMNLFGLLQGKIYDSFYLVDVLHCIGLSLLGIIGIYLLTQNRKKFVFPTVLLGITLTLFLFEPTYKTWGFSFLPDAFANYLTKSNGSVFTIIPWFGYAVFGSFLSVVFTKFKDFKYLYFVAIPLFAAVGMVLVSYSSKLFLLLSQTTGLQLFADIYFNNYLFIRLGNVLVVFSIFMLIRGILKNSTLLKIGQSTLSVYIVHFIILYGSFTGVGLYRFFHHSLTPAVAISGALCFMVICTFTALRYEANKEVIRLKIATSLRFALVKGEVLATSGFQTAKTLFFRLLRRVGWAKN
ncbi:heparan-alpha-glucosaminide N-acetyltransferase domain-containing protein [Zobellia uliginosa]|uniref:heparan-alpha-glucosaminide N-acetyltransferase domain-containing protein n=1 Tax=Zobellia uliginosa TaxID=143224 RepID=UPI0026E137C5|nr:heparan-alpha-glucosaminide N-acetyltransferase domain-containing protein [Zobellia uliginosa]MDO6516916.1 heparan-alpha-glucosaminide N-acetyltransferase domain-containing protein [Zobellia uliginosa]